MTAARRRPAGASALCAVAMLSAASCQRDRARGDRAPAPERSAAPTAPSAPPAPLPAPFASTGARGPDEIDAAGIGGLTLGDLADGLPLLGYRTEGPQGRVSFSQGGVDRTIASGVNERWTRSLGSDEQVIVNVDPVQRRVDRATVRAPGVATAEGVGVGTTLAEVARIYGPPEDTWAAWPGTCARFAKRPGVALCTTRREAWASQPPETRLEILQIPASYRSPLPLGEDLRAISAALEGHLVDGAPVLPGQLAGGERALVSPCTLRVGGASPSSSAVVARRGEVYQMEGGWQRSDGSWIVCVARSVYTRDAAGAAVRWGLDVSEDRWVPEPASCTLDPGATRSRVRCRGSTERFGFSGYLIDDLLVAEASVDHLAARRAPRIERSAHPDTPEGRCEREVDAAWERVRPALVFAGLPHDDRARIAHLTSGRARQFLERCLAGHERELDAWPHASRGLVETKPPAASPARLRQLADLLDGTWRPAEPARGAWLGELTFGQRGRRLAIEKFPDRAFEVAVASHGVLNAEDPRQIVPIAIAVVDRDHFFSGPIEWLADRDHFELQLPDRATLLVRGAVCKVVVRGGELRDAGCELASQPAGDALRVSYTAARGPVSLDYRVIDSYLVPADATPYQRVPEAR